MIKRITLKVLPSVAASNDLLRQSILDEMSLSSDELTGFEIKRQSIDARNRRQVWYQILLDAFINEPFQPSSLLPLSLQDVTHAKNPVIIVGAGPAGLFAAIRLISAGIRPIILERGKDVRDRRRDLAAINKQGEVNPESNYCFGEGGAGTYSDGKLYTRSTKRGDIHEILSILVHFGAQEKILYEAHPHIGTNKLPQIITGIREQIRQSGGAVLFNKKVVSIHRQNDQITGVSTSDGERFDASAVILATGHSARDIFAMFQKEGLSIEAKPFALGVRVEHPQELIDSIQYHQPMRDPFLPPASYSLVEQVEGRGVFSFCMCPGGIIAPASTAPGEIVVNGWSPSKRNNPFANSGMVVSVEPENLKALAKWKELAGLEFQRSVEQKAYEAGGGNLVAPAQRLVDFTSNKLSTSLPGCSYLPGVRSAPLGEVLPGFVHTALQQAFQAFGKKMKGYFTNEALVVATESRTSSPVRIPRDPQTLEHPQLRGLYPCGEGAGYAGGIVSAAMDGIAAAKMIVERENR